MTDNDDFDGFDDFEIEDLEVYKAMGKLKEDLLDFDKSYIPREDFEE